jgi:predicted secreted protein
MSITAAFVLYAVTWFMVFFVVLQTGNHTQAEAGEIVPGTPAGAPAGFVMARKLRVTTMVATPLWAIMAGIILSGWISIRDFDVMQRMGPEPVIQTN